MRRVHTWGWRRTRRYDEPSNDLAPLSPRQSCPACIIDTLAGRMILGKDREPARLIPFGDKSGPKLTQDSPEAFTG